MEAKNQPVDCFYLYPTTSLDATLVSDLAPGKDEELITAYVQAARFREHCRVFAPLYRQNTLTSLRAAAQGRPMNGDRSVIYADVLNSWNHYLQHENKGRGVVLIGHSQGASLLTRLIAAEIDGKPIQKQVISALLIGSAVAVPQGKVIGGSFKSIPLCTAANQVGCVISFASYRATTPPTGNANFGRVRGSTDTVAACVNPAALTSGTTGKVKLDGYMSTVGEISLSRRDYLPWTNPPKLVQTPFVSLPGLLLGECVQRGEFSYLEITIDADTKDARTDDIIGDVVMANGSVNHGWGLHIIDMSMTMGNLVDIVGRQTKSYLEK
jgi:pimeloyl-ACP methyl ester carboxylesterase